MSPVLNIPTYPERVRKKIVGKQADERRQSKAIHNRIDVNMAQLEAVAAQGKENEAPTNDADTSNRDEGRSSDMFTKSMDKAMDAASKATDVARGASRDAIATVAGARSFTLDDMKNIEVGRSLGEDGSARMTIRLPAPSGPCPDE